MWPICAGPTLVIDADMRLDLAGQRLDLAGMIHADLEHAVARLARQAGQADRHADMVVEDAVLAEVGA